MSMCEKEEIQCPVCGTTGEFEMWKSVNTVLNPEKKEQLLSGSLFQYICPHCGKSYNIDYPMLYHQMEDQIMIYYVVQEEDIQMVEKQFRGDFGSAESEITKVLKEDMDSYLYRIVGSQRELMEKIRIFDAGKDDRIVELVKRIIIDAVADKNPDLGMPTSTTWKKTENPYLSLNSKAPWVPFRFRKVCTRIWQRGCGKAADLEPQRVPDQSCLGFKGTGNGIRRRRFISQALSKYSGKASNVCPFRKSRRN